MAKENISVDIDGVDWREEGLQYDRIHHRLKRIADIINNNKKITTVLDIGSCGCKLETILSKKKYYACDIICDFVPKKNEEQFCIWNVEKSQISELTFDIRKFDCIVISGVFEHVENIDSCVSKVKELLNPNGYVILTYANPDFILYKLNIATRENDSNWLNRLSKSAKIMQVFKGNRFDIVDIFHLSYFVYYKSNFVFGKLLNWISNQYIYVFKNGK